MAVCGGVVLVVEDHPLVRTVLLEVMIEAGLEALDAWRRYGSDPDA